MDENPQSRTSSSYALGSARPRTKRQITGFEDFSKESAGDDGGLLSPSIVSPSFERASSFPRLSSPLPSTHPSRSPSQAPSSKRATTQGQDPNGDLAASLAGLWGKSWTSLQGLASNVLGSDLSSEPVKDNARPPAYSAYSSSFFGSTIGAPSQWGPSGSAAQSTQPGAGSKQVRHAVVTAKKRKELLTINGSAFENNAAHKHKRRTSDEVNSLPAQHEDDGEILIYVHRVTADDTIAGISIRYNCPLAMIKKVNRMWSNDGIQARKTLMLPVDSCKIRGRKIEQNTVATNGHTEHVSLDPANEYDDRRGSTITITPESAGLASTETRTNSGSNRPPDDQPWSHDSWTILDGQAEATEIARLPLQNLGHFPRARRKSDARSSLDRSSGSLELSRPHPSSTPSEESFSSRASLHRSRRSSGSNQFAQQMFGPGGVGSLKGKGPSTPGPAEDKLTKVFRKQLSGMIKVPTAASDDDYFSSAASTPNFAEFGQAMEGWAKKVSKGLAKALEAPHPAEMRRQRRAAGFSSTSGGDLIELANSFELCDDGLDDDDLATPTNGPPARAYRSSLDIGRNGTSGDTAYKTATRPRSVQVTNRLRRKDD